MAYSLTVTVELDSREAAGLVRLANKLDLPVDKVIINAIRMYHDSTFPVKELSKKKPKENKQLDRCRDCGASPTVNNTRLCLACDRLNYAG